MIYIRNVTRALWKNVILIFVKRGNKISEIIVGSCEQLLEHKSALNALLSDELCMLISEDKSE